jgi:hypothetical protein
LTSGILWDGIRFSPSSVTLAGAVAVPSGKVLRQGLYFPHSLGFSGRACHHSSKASRRENLEVEEPVACRNFPAFDFHPTRPGMLGPTLIRHQVVQVRQPREKRLLAPLRMMEALHREQLPLDSVMGLIQEGAGRGHLRVGEDCIPAGLLVLEPAPDALPVGRPSRTRDVVGNMAEPLAQRKHAHALALACPVQQSVELGA